MHVLGNIGRHHWTECLKISKTANFESNLLTTNENTAGRKNASSRKILLWRTFVNFRSFAELYLRSLQTKFVNFINFKALFSVVSTDVP